jgi:hypothetical protein
MTGPPYPRTPPAGDPTPLDWWLTIESQYANSPIITALISNFYDCLNQAADFEAFYDLMWNVSTAQGYGLDVWGRIVGVQRVLQVPGGTNYLAFQESGNPGSFGQGIFYSGQTTTGNFILADDAFLILILAKALANISDGSVKAINQLLLNLFPGRGNAYVIDNLDLSMVYKFTFSLTPAELSIVQNSGALPRPPGVSVTISTPP